MNIPRFMKLIAVSHLIPLAFAASAADESGLARYEPLIKRNPFLPKSDAAKPAGQPSATAPYRFTGLVTVGKKTLVALEKPAENRSFLLPVGQNVDGLELKEINPKEKTILLAANGETMRLAMVETAAMAPPPGPAVAAANPPPGPGVAVGPSPWATPAVTSTGAVQQVRRRIIVPKRN